MEWDEIRGRYLAIWKHKRLTQVKIAERGKLDQSRLSNIKTDPNYVPTVDVFRRAVEGLGLTLAEFFSQTYAQTNTDLKFPAHSGQTPLPEQTAVAPSGGNDHGGSDNPLSAASATDVRRIQDLFEDLSVAYGELALHFDIVARKTGTPRARKSPRVDRARTNRG